MKVSTKEKTYYPKHVQSKEEEAGETFTEEQHPTLGLGQRSSKTNRFYPYPGQGGTGSGSKEEKIPKWFEGLQKQAKQLAFADTLAPSEKQRSHYFSALNRMEQLTQEVAQQAGVSLEEAVPTAINRYAKEENWGILLKQQMPPANKGQWNNKKETIQIAQEFLRQGTPEHVIGQAMQNRGWDNNAISDMLYTAQTLIPFEKSGLDPALIRNTQVKDGQSIKDQSGQIWQRRGKYLVNIVTLERIDLDDVPR
jgi:hypothetical protein